MTDHRDDSSSLRPPVATNPPERAEDVAAEDLGCLQSALDNWQREHDRQPARSHAREADAQAKLQQAERRLNEALGQLEATRRSTHAVRVRLDADVQAARTRAQEAQAELAARQTVAEQLRVENAELSTALDATEWRLGELEAESTAHREALLQMQQEHRAKLQRLAELEELAAAHAAHAQLETEQQTQRSALEADLQRQQAAHLDELSARQQAAAQRETELRAACRDAATLATRIESIEADLRAAHAQRQQIEQQYAAAQTERRTLEADLRQLRSAHADELDAWQQAATQREAELVAARDALAQQLAAEQLQARTARDDAATLAARVESIEADLHAAQAQRQQIEQQYAAAQTERSTLEADLLQLRTAHADELDAWQQAATQREAELVAARDALAQQLAAEQLQAQTARDDAATLATRIESIEADLHTAHTQRQQIEQQYAAAETERSTLEADLRQLRTAHADELDVWQARAAEHQSDREALTSRVRLLEDEVQQRVARIEQLRADIGQLEARQTQGLQTAAEAVQRREEEWRATQRTLRDELDSVRGTLTDTDAARTAAQQCSDALRQQLEKRTIEFNEIHQRAEVAAALAQQNAEARVVAEQHAMDLQHRHTELLQTLEDIQQQSALPPQQRDAMAAQIGDIENERSALALRVDELTALTGQLERECDRLRRDRGSIEETRRLKADNARLENKIIELDRQRSEAAQRHSAAVAGYMIELNQRSEALQARGVELHKLTEELTLLRQSCEDAVGDLAAQRREQDALDRELAKLRATPAPAATGVLSEPISPAPPVEPRPSAAPPTARPAPAKPAKRPPQAGTVTGPVSVIHLEENTALCDAARDVVARLPNARYVNALDATSADHPGSRLLVVNLLSRAHDPVAAIASFIAADNYHRNVLAYCAEGANGFSFGTADFFAQPIDPDACVARLLESRGTIQRLLVVSDNFGVVGMLRDVLSRMRSSVSAALDLRQVLDLLPMVEPDVVLIDLGLPRGEGLRLVSRLRSEPKTRELALAILLAAPGGSAGEFRQHALRAVRDLPMAPTQLAEALSQRLGAPRAGDRLTLVRSGATALA
jgi:chromosome segregation ATPase